MRFDSKIQRETVNDVFLDYYQNETTGDLYVILKFYNRKNELIKEINEKFQFYEEKEAINYMRKVRAIIEKNKQLGSYNDLEIDNDWEKIESEL